MIWQFDYEGLFENLVMTCGQKGENLRAAYEKARNYFGGDKTAEDFIVIKVEDYSCVALVTDDFTPIEIAEQIFPYDAERVYPMQGVCIKPQFIR